MEMIWLATSIRSFVMDHLSGLCFGHLSPLFLFFGRIAFLKLYAAAALIVFNTDKGTCNSAINNEDYMIDNRHTILYITNSRIDYFTFLLLFCQVHRLGANTAMKNSVLSFPISSHQKCSWGTIHTCLMTRPKAPRQCHDVCLSRESKKKPTFSPSDRVGAMDGTKMLFSKWRSVGNCYCWTHGFGLLKKWWFWLIL
jgi:hypothetical protein